MIWGFDWGYNWGVWLGMVRGVIGEWGLEPIMYPSTIICCTDLGTSVSSSSFILSRASSSAENIGVACSNNISCRGGSCYCQYPLCSPPPPNTPSAHRLPPIPLLLTNSPQYPSAHRLPPIPPLLTNSPQYPLGSPTPPNTPSAHRLPPIGNTPSAHRFP